MRIRHFAGGAGPRRSACSSAPVLAQVGPTHQRAVPVSRVSRIGVSPLHEAGRPADTCTLCCICCMHPAQRLLRPAPQLSQHQHHTLTAANTPSSYLLPQCTHRSTSLDLLVSRFVSEEIPPARKSAPQTCIAGSRCRCVHRSNASSPRHLKPDCSPLIRSLHLVENP